MLDEKLRKLRIEKGLQQKDVAENVGVSATMISNYERGTKKPSSLTLLNLAKFFNVSIDYLVSDSDNIEIGNDTQRVYEQLKSYLRNYEYEQFKKAKNNEDTSELDKIISILKTLDKRATYELYTNLDKEEEYKRNFGKAVRAILYFSDFCNAITSTFYNNEEIDINKLFDEAKKASYYCSDKLAEITKFTQSYYIESYLDSESIDIDFSKK